MKKTFFIALVLVMAMAFTACSAPNNTTTQDKKSEQQNTQAADEKAKDTDMKQEPKEEMQDGKTNELQFFTLEDLAKFNGKDGQKAYIAVDGVVYDVTDHPAWKDGGHNGFEAGQDLTEAIKTKAPHGVVKLEELTLIGELVDKLPEVMEEKQDGKTNEMQFFTLEELATFNGKDGQKAYIAVDGVVYDVTDHPAWKDGGHNGFEAGQDLTEAIKTKSPHGISKMEGIPVVGTLK